MLALPWLFWLQYWACVYRQLEQAEERARGQL
jgi:hypothetical protein